MKRIDWYGLTIFVLCGCLAALALFNSASPGVCVVVPAEQVPAPPSGLKVA